jgi:hypothetical protein
VPRHKVLVILILASLAVAAAIPAGAQARRSLTGPGYKTYVPSGWHIKRAKSSGWSLKVASAPHSASALQVRIGTIGVVTLQKRLKVKALPSSPTDLVQALVPLPPGAVNVQVVAQPQVTTLSGAVGGFLALHYQVGNEGTAMSLTAIRRGNRVYLLDVLGGDGLSVLGTPAIDVVNKGWRWT